MKQKTQDEEVVESYLDQLSPEGNMTKYLAKVDAFFNSFAMPYL
jgi:hypothetical protein